MGIFYEITWITSNSIVDRFVEMYQNPRGLSLVVVNEPVHIQIFSSHRRFSVAISLRPRWLLGAVTTLNRKLIVCLPDIKEHWLAYSMQKIIWIASKYCIMRLKRFRSYIDIDYIVHQFGVVIYINIYIWPDNDLNGLLSQFGREKILCHGIIIDIKGYFIDSYKISLAPCFPLSFILSGGKN